MHSFAGLFVAVALALTACAQTQAPVWGQCTYLSALLLRIHLAHVFYPRWWLSESSAYTYRCLLISASITRGGLEQRAALQAPSARPSMTV